MEAENARLRAQVREQDDASGWISAGATSSARVGSGGMEANGRQQRTIFDSAVELAIVATDRDGRVTDWNASTEHILGWTA